MRPSAQGSSRSRGLISCQQKAVDNVHDSATHKIQLVKCLRPAAHKCEHKCKCLRPAAHNVCDRLHTEISPQRRNLSKGSTLKRISAPALSLCRHTGKLGNKKVMKITLRYRRTISSTQGTAHSSLPHDATVADVMAAGTAGVFATWTPGGAPCPLLA